MNGEELWHIQRLLRSALLDGRAPAMPGEADLVAHLLLYLDDSERCWKLGLDWIRRQLDADRVDGGFAAPWAIYQPAVESLRGDAGMPSAVGKAFDPREPSLRSVWASPHPVVFDDISHDDRFTPQLRKSLQSLQTGSKLAIGLRDGSLPVGLICCDWTREGRRRDDELYRQVSELAREVLGPVLAASSRYAQDCRENREDGAPVVSGSGTNASMLAELTPGELEVARLVVSGMSYKEIAVRLNRSFSTVDHRLRAIRVKLGARSTARMIAMLSDLLATKSP